MGLASFSYAAEEANLPPPVEIAATVYEIDPAHSTFGFAVKHLGVSTTHGAFNTFHGSVVFDPNNLSAFKANVEIEAASINTNVEARDKHLRSPDFFDAEKFPQITFKSNRLEKRGEGMVIIGDLTMKAVTKELTIPVTVSGPIAGPMGGEVIGLSAQIQLNRQDFGVSYSKMLDNGGLMVADMVDVTIEIEADHKEAAK